jgi:cell division ATPase FtsA
MKTRSIKNRIETLEESKGLSVSNVYLSLAKTFEFIRNALAIPDLSIDKQIEDQKMYVASMNEKELNHTDGFLLEQAKYRINQLKES